MIGYLEGKLLKQEEERILLLVQQVGYEILLPAFVRDMLKARQTGDEVALYIYYHQTERQPKPVLIGFNLEAEKDFFQRFITVDDIGPLKAVKALSLPVADVAHAIECGDLDRLRNLPGIGPRSAQKIVATLKGKVEKFVLTRKPEGLDVAPPAGFMQPVLDVLVIQLGHKPADAKRMIADAIKRDPAIETPEALFDEIYRGERPSRHDHMP
jgi:holliday junction DNA helicase RuvA